MEPDGTHIGEHHNMDKETRKARKADKRVDRAWWVCSHHATAGVTTGSCG